MCKSLTQQLNIKARGLNSTPFTVQPRLSDCLTCSERGMNAGDVKACTLCLIMLFGATKLQYFVPLEGVAHLP